MHRYSDTDTADEQFVFVHKKKPDGFFIDLTQDEPESKRMKMDKCGANEGASHSSKLPSENSANGEGDNDDIQIIKCVPGHVARVQPECQVSEISVMQQAKFEQWQNVQLSLCEIQPVPDIVKQYECANYDCGQVIDISNCTIDIAKVSSVRHDKFIDLTGDDNELHNMSTPVVSNTIAGEYSSAQACADPDVAVPASPVRPPNDGIEQNSNDNSGIHADVGEGIVTASQGDSNSEIHESQCQPACGDDGTDNIPDSTDNQCNADTTYTPRVLYQNQLEDPDVVAEFDRPMYGE